MEWLDESEKTLDSEVEIANDPGKIKMQLSLHKVSVVLSKLNRKKKKVKAAISYEPLQHLQ